MNECMVFAVVVFSVVVSVFFADNEFNIIVFIIKIVLHHIAK